MSATDVANVEVEAINLPPGEDVPNHPRWPLLLYRQAVPHNAGEVERLIESNKWAGVWRNGVHSYHHFHTTAHEVLAVVAGRATLQFGGENGQAVALSAGDVAILPAGTGHKRLDASNDFLLVGAYPQGQEDYDLQRAPPGDAQRKRVARTPRPAADPIFGARGPLMQRWAE